MIGQQVLLIGLIGAEQQYKPGPGSDQAQHNRPVDSDLLQLDCCVDLSSFEVSTWGLDFS